MTARVLSFFCSVLHAFPHISASINSHTPHFFTSAFVLSSFHSIRFLFYFHLLSLLSCFHVIPFSSLFLLFVFFFVFFVLFCFCFLFCFVWPCLAIFWVVLSLFYILLAVLLHHVVQYYITELLIWAKQSLVSSIFYPWAQTLVVWSAICQSVSQSVSWIRAGNFIVVLFYWWYKSECVLFLIFLL